MPSNHLVLCRPLLFLPSIFPSIRVFSNESVLCIRWPKYWSFSFSISPFNEYSGLISFRIDCYNLLAVQGDSGVFSSTTVWKHQFFSPQLSLWSNSHKLPAAAAAAKSLQSCPILCDPIDGSPPGSPIPGILQARTLGWAAISFSNAWKWKVKVKSLSRVRLLAAPWTAAYQAPPSIGFSRQEYWSRLPLPSPHKLPIDSHLSDFQFFPVINKCVMYHLACILSHTYMSKVIVKFLDPFTACLLLNTHDRCHDSFTSQ